MNENENEIINEGLEQMAEDDMNSNFISIFEKIQKEVYKNAVSKGCGIMMI